MASQLSKVFELTLKQQAARERCLVNIIENSNKIRTQMPCAVYSDDYFLGAATLSVRKGMNADTIVKVEVDCVKSNLTEIISNSLGRSFIFKLIVGGEHDPGVVGIKLVFTDQKDLPTVDFLRETHTLVSIEDGSKLLDRSSNFLLRVQLQELSVANPYPGAW